MVVFICGCTLSILACQKSLAPCFKIILMPMQIMRVKNI